MAPRADVSRDLLFGLLGLGTGLIDQAELVRAFHVWTRAHDRPMAEILVEQGSLESEQCALLDALVALNLKKHAGDAERSLAALKADRATCERLAESGDPELTASIERLCLSSTELEDADPDRTRTYSVGSATSGGQRFRVLRAHARGGIGEVMVAFDTELNREVALKQIQEKHASDRTTRARFVREAEITGGLEHPGIVPVYGLGAGPDGRPFYAMRLIKGNSLKEAIAQRTADESLKPDPGSRSLALRKLLRRFLDVCNAIDYAHRRGVLHRDLKPANVVVGKHGETLVVDWGLAKALGKAETDSVTDERVIVPSLAGGLTETLPGSAIGTPAYMSPEQAGGAIESLGLRSDVYSLGAILYAVLTGRAPFERTGVGDVLRAVQAGAFPAPRKLDATIDRALEAICLKAMALKPADRYGSARELGDEVERWMAGEPVAAYRERWTERARRWLKRHRTGVSAAMAAGAVAVLSLGAATILLLSAYHEVQGERDKARARFQMAREAVDGFYTQVSESGEMKAHGLELLRRDLLDSAVAFYRRLAGEETGDASVRAEQGRAYARLAVLLCDLERNDQARSAFDHAAAVFRQLVREQPRKVEYERELAATLERRGVLEHDTGHYDAAEPPHREALGLRRHLADIDPRDPVSRRDVAGSLHALGRLKRDSSHLADAEPLYQQALDIRRQLLAEFPDAPEYRDDLALTEFNIANLYIRMRRFDEGEQAYLRALGLWERLVAAYPNSTSYLLLLSNTCNNLANVYDRLGRLNLAQQYHLRALAMHQQLADAHPLVPRWEEDLAKSLQNLANVELHMGQMERAQSGLDQAIAIRRRLVRDYPEILEFAANLAETYSDVGDLNRELGQNPLALQWYDQALEQIRMVLRQQPSYGAAQGYLEQIYVGQARALSDLHRAAEADAALRSAESADQKRNDPGMRVCRALLRARSGDHAAAAAEAGDLARDRWLSGRYLFDLARAYAVLISSAPGAATAAQDGDAAMALLERARAAGLFTNPVALRSLATDMDFDSLRHRSDFQSLQTDVSFPADPFAP